MAIRNNQLENAPRSMEASPAAPGTVPNSGLFYTKDVSGVVEAFYLDNNGSEVQITENGLVRVTGLLGEINDGANVGAGEGTVFKQKSGVDLEFKTLKAGSNITIDNTDPDFILISGPTNAGEANTVSNIGGGNELFKQKTLVDLEFRTLIAGTGIAMVAGADSLTISATGSGGGSSLSVHHEGTTIDSDVTNIDFVGSAVEVAQSAPGNIQVSITGGGETNTSSNLGLGEGLASTKSGVNLPFKSLVAGTNVTLSSDSTSVTINAAATGGGSGDLISTNNLSDVTSASTSLANLGGQADLDVPSQAEAEAGTSTSERVWTAERINQSIQALSTGGGATNLNGLTDVTVSTPADTQVLTYNGSTWVNAAPTGGGGSGDLISTNNLSDVTSASTSLANLGGQADLDVPSQAEAEAGTSTSERVWTAERINQSIQALAPAGGGGSTQIFKIVLPDAASLAARIALATFPAGWTITSADLDAEGQFGSDTESLVIIWDAGLGINVADISVYDNNTATNAIGGVKVTSTSESFPSNIKTNSSLTKAVVQFGSVGGLPAGRDVYVKIDLV